MNPRNLMAVAIVVVAGVAAACSSAATAPPTSSAPTAAPPTSSAPTAAPPTSSAPTAAPPTSSAPTAAPPASSGGPAITTATVGSQGTLIVAGANGMTVYTFANDVANSGTSACTAGCITKWPALTVPTGSTPAGGSGATGKLGTITRADDGSTQVTYNGLPLYFYTGDKTPGDANGIYPNWSAVKP